MNSLTERDFSLGTRGAVAALTGGYVVLRGTEYALGVRRTPSLLPFYPLIQSVQNGLLRVALKLSTIFSLIVLIPLLEEWLFRGVLYSYQEKEHSTSRAFRVISNGIVFGAFHLNPFAGTGALVVLAVAIVTGMVFAALREKTGKIYASTIAHSLNNAVVVFLNLWRF